MHGQIPYSQAFLRSDPMIENHESAARAPNREGYTRAISHPLTNLGRKERRRPHPREASTPGETANHRRYLSA
jgi:hypothetical protein